MLRGFYRHRCMYESIELSFSLKDTVSEWRFGLRTMDIER